MTAPDSRETAFSLNEAFYSIQGEGARTGEASIFLRLAGCNLDCSFCDTDWKHGDKVAVNDKELGKLLGNLIAIPDLVTDPGWVVLTGGEPTAAPAFPGLVKYLLDNRYSVQIETNGTRYHPVMRECHVTVSPKIWWEGDKAQIDERYREDPRSRGGIGRHPIELKVVVDQNTTRAKLEQLLADLPFEPMKYWLQPVYEAPAAWTNAYNLVRAWPMWRLSLQTHKWLRVR